MSQCVLHGSAQSLAKGVQCHWCGLLRVQIRAVADRFIYDQDMAVASVGDVQFMPDYNWWRRRRWAAIYCFVWQWGEDVPVKFLCLHLSSVGLGWCSSSRVLVFALCGPGWAHAAQCQGPSFVTFILGGCIGRKGNNGDRVYSRIPQRSWEAFFWRQRQCLITSQHHTRTALAHPACPCPACSYWLRY